MSIAHYEYDGVSDIEAISQIDTDEVLQHYHAPAAQPAFHLFLLINATLFLRPAEIVPALAGLPIYEVLNLICIALCFPQMMNNLKGARLAAAPIVACVIGLQFAIILSDLSHFELESAITCATDFAKVVAYFLLLITVVDSPRRLRTFLLALLWLTTILTALALMHFHGYINIPAMAAAKEMWAEGDGEEAGELLRLCAAGIYGNPNDLARILIVGMFLAVYFTMSKDSSPLRYLWIGPFLMMGYALQLTHSRGGLLALMAGLGLLFKMRFGWGKFLLASFIVTPLLLIAFSGRQLEMSTSSGTGQQRIRLWAEGLTYFRHSPLFGIGMNRFQEFMGLAAHNSFVQCFVDLGLVGGTIFLSSFYLAMRGIHRAGQDAGFRVSEEFRRLQPYMIAIVGSAIVGMFSSTRSYTIPTYTILGIAASFLFIHELESGSRQAALTWKLARQLTFLSIVALVGISVYVRLFAVWE